MCCEIHSDTRQFAPSTLAAVVLFLVATAFLASCKKTEDGSTDKRPGSPDANAFDASSPKKAAITFARALEADDMVSARKVAVGTDAEFSLAKGFGQIMRSLRSYEAVAVQKLGDDGKLSQEDTGDLVDLLAASNSAVEKIDGNTGTLDFARGTIVRFKKEGDSWKMILDWLDIDPQGEAYAKALPEKARVLDEVKAEIEAGKYARAREAIKELKARLIALGEERPEVKAKEAIATLKLAIELYKQNVGAYPPSLDGLVKNVVNSVDWKGPYVGEKPTPVVPVDPWGHRFKYAVPGTHNTDGFDLWSAGDGKHPPQGLDNWSPDSQN